VQDAPMAVSAGIDAQGGAKSVISLRTEGGYLEEEI
jgi:hypothetical protein